MADVDVADEPDALERVEVAVDARLVEPAGELVGGARPVGGEEASASSVRRVPETRMPRGAERDDGSGQRRRGERLRAMRDGHGWGIGAVLRRCPRSAASTSYAPRGERGSLRVRAAQRHASCGTACAVSASPTTTISAGRDRRHRGRQRARHGQPRRAAGRRGRRRCRAPLSVAASPAENATIRTSPSPIRCWATAPSSTTSADGHGISPADAPSASRLRRDGRGAGSWRGDAVVVRAVRVVVRRAGGGGRPAEAPAQHARPRRRRRAAPDSSVSHG